MCLYYVCLGMSSGSVFWDDENDNNDNSVNGTVPSGVYDEDTLIHYCCMTNGDTSDPITLPSNRPFYLFPYDSSCQEVEGMNVSEEWFEWDDDEDTRSGNSTGSHPRRRSYGYGAQELQYCYYTMN